MRMSASPYLSVQYPWCLWHLNMKLISYEDVISFENANISHSQLRLTSPLCNGNVSAHRPYLTSWLRDFTASSRTVQSMIKIPLVKRNIVCTWLFKLKIEACGRSLLHLYLRERCESCHLPCCCGNAPTLLLSKTTRPLMGRAVDKPVPLLLETEGCQNVL